VFIGRYFDNEDDFKRMDFTLSDLNSSAPWIQEAQQQILRRSQRSSNTQALMHNLQQQHTDSKQAAAAAAATAAGGGSSAAKQQSPSEVEKVKGNEVSGGRGGGWVLGRFLVWGPLTVSGHTVMASTTEGGLKAGVAVTAGNNPLRGVCLEHD